jgi:hypothetical protein
MPFVYISSRGTGVSGSDADQVSGPDGADRVAGLDYLRDALVAECERALERHGAADDPQVQVAGRHRDRPHDRLPVALQPWLRRIAPLQPAGLDEGELLHGREDPM